jgi:IclR family KDG regulon transcriptional repressor
MQASHQDDDDSRQPESVAAVLKVFAILQALAERRGETVHPGMLIDSEIIYVHKVDSRHMLGMYSSVGRRAPIHCTAIAKVLLAGENTERRAHALAGMNFERFRDKTITDHAAFIQELDRTKAQGLGQDREEFDDHIRCLGVPVFNQAVAGLSVSLPTFRNDEAREPEIVVRLREASRAIREPLGCTNFPLGSKP